MTNRDHDRAVELIMRRGTEEIAGADGNWLNAHLAECLECSRYAADFDQTGELLRSVAVTASRALVVSTQQRLRARALYLQEQRSRVVLIAISFCIGTLTSVLSSWLWWRFGGWIAERLGMSSAIVQPGMFVVSLVPTVIIAVVMLVSSHPVIDRSLIMNALGEHQEGAEQ
jgi:hypothetical protein